MKITLKDESTGKNIKTGNSLISFPLEKANLAEINVAALQAGIIEAKLFLKYGGQLYRVEPRIIYRLVDAGLYNVKRGWLLWIPEPAAIKAGKGIFEIRIRNRFSCCCTTRAKYHFTIE